MKIRSILAFFLAALAVLGLAACGGETPAPVTTTQASAPDSQPAEPAVTTAEAAPATEAPKTEAPAATEAPKTEAPVTTAAVEIDYPLNGVGVLEGNELADYKALLPALLPDGTVPEKFTRGMALDDSDYDFYSIAGNSLPTFEWVDVAGGALYGHAAKFAAAGKDENNRGEITVTPFYENNPQGARGILFWVDMSHVKPKEGATPCASVTINTNSIRSNNNLLGEIKAYYEVDGLWNETTNVNACRLALPEGFKGWVWVPATSYYLTSEKGDDGRYKNSAADADGKFTDIEVTNMRCYTDGYTYSYDDYIIFDEILFVF